MWGAVGEVKKNKQTVTGLVFLVRGAAASGPPMATLTGKTGEKKLKNEEAKLHSEEARRADVLTLRGMGRMEGGGRG